MDMTIPPATLLTDADVLINYRESEFDVLELITQHIGAVAVLADVLLEADDLTPHQCEQLGIKVVETRATWLMQAAEASEYLPFNAYLSLLACIERGWTCVTNDGALRRLCIRRGVAAKCGIGPVEDLVDAGVLTPRRAIAIARRIQGLNPYHMNERAIVRLTAEIAGRISG